GLLRTEGEVHLLTDGKDVVLALPGVKPESSVTAKAKALLGDPVVGVLLRGGRQTHSVGRTRLHIDGIDGQLPVQANALSFAQANAPRNAALVRHVVGRARADGQRVLELFCGAGNFTRALARVARRVWALDDDREAVNALRALAEEHRLAINAKRGQASSWLSRMEKNGSTYDVVVLDPTRRGLGQSEAASLARVATSRIVYVSCDPATLARDLKVLVDKGWAVADVTVFDLMPMTPEVETVVTLLPKGSKLT
ncbi:MAG: RsmD family RNA methyltransferase, partial [Myxococcota bacterium]